jgi:hypothetical protein
MLNCNESVTIVVQPRSRSDSKMQAFASLPKVPVGMGALSKQTQMLTSGFIRDC